MKGAPLLSLDAVCLGYPRGPDILSGAGLELEAGSFAALIGPNGSGKSTLLFALGGLMAPRSGTIRVGGRDLYRMPRNERARSVSIVLTDAVKPEWMRAREIAALGRQPLTGPMGTLSAEDRDAVDRALELSGASSFAQRYFAQLSDGERQKVLIARALAQDCPLILLDEPTVFLDAPSKRDSLDLLRLLARREGKTVIAALHEIDLALEYADALWLAVPGEKRVVADVPEALALSGGIAAAFKPPRAKGGEAGERDFGRGSMDALFGRGTETESGPRPLVSVEGGSPEARYWTEALLRRRGYAISRKEDPGLSARLEIHALPEGAFSWQWNPRGMREGSPARTVPGPAEFAGLGDLARHLG